MPRYFIQLAYDGTNYNGWQIQDTTTHTIQQVLEEKLSLILGEAIDLVGCGRTDTGVHAKDYFAHFDSRNANLHQTDTNYVYKLNKILPPDIAIKKIHSVSDSVNARFEAESRTYHYLLHTFKNPFLNRYSLLVTVPLNIEAMNEAAAHLLTVTDFTSFSKVNTQTKTNDCSVTAAQWFRISENEYLFEITANRFLRNMVRAIVGTLLEVGKGKITIEQFKTIVQNKNRSSAGMSMPAHALYLVNIKYPKAIFND